MASPVIKLYQRIEFEPRAYRREERAEKTLLTYGESLERLQRAEYKRHPSPAEEFSMIIDHLEGKLPPDLEATAKDMLSSFGEHLGVLWERKGCILVAHREQGGSPMRYTQHKLSVGNLPSNQLIELKDLPKDVVTFHYSRPLNRLPSEIRVNAGIYLPPEGIIRPVCRGDFISYFNVGNFIDGRSSRGVRVRQASGASKSGAAAQKISAPTLEEALIKEILDDARDFVHPNQMEAYEARLRESYNLYRKE